MAQTLALLAKNPQFDLGTVLGNAQRLRAGEQQIANADVQGQLNRLKLGEEQDRTSALAAFRDAGGVKGGMAAADTLSGQPDLYASVVDLHRKLSADPEKQKRLEQTATKISLAADRVARLPEGSRERLAAWNETLETFRKDGTINDGQYRQWYGHPSALVLEQAMSLGMAMKDVIARRDKESGGGLTPKDRLDIEGKVNDFSKNYFGSNNYSFLSKEQVAERDKATADYRQKLIDELGGGAKPKIGADAGNVLDLTRRTPPGAEAPALSAPNIFDNTPMAQQGGPQNGGGDGSSKEGAVQFTPGSEKAEFDALPVGSWFVNPADGRVLIKTK